MLAHGRLYFLSSLLIFFYEAVAVLTTPWSSSTDSFAFGNCTELKFIPGSPYHSNVNLLLNHLVISSASTSYANFTVVGSAPQNTIYGLFQCREDLNYSDCWGCVSRAVGQLGMLCSDSLSGALQLEGCFVKYDNKSFFGVVDKTQVAGKCGQQIGFDAVALTAVDASLSYLATTSGAYRVSFAGDVQGVAQCVGDLSPIDCQDCLSDAISRLSSACRPLAWGDVYLAKCYARFTRDAANSQQGEKDKNGTGDWFRKALPIIGGVIGGVALFLTIFRKIFDKRKGSIDNKPHTTSHDDDDKFTHDVSSIVDGRF